MKYNDFDDYKYNGKPMKKPCCKPWEDPCDDKCDKPWDKDCDKHDKHDKDKKEDSCCNCDMRDALKLLFDPSVKNDVDFDEFAFIGKNFIVGAFIEEEPNADEDNINIDDANFQARLVSVNNCSCDLIRIESDRVYYPVPEEKNDQNEVTFNISVAYASLCDLDAIAFNIDNGNNFIRDFVKLLDKKHQCNDRKCNECECKCNKGILKNLFNPFSSNAQVNLTAGSLALRDAKVLGRLGNILVLSKSDKDRIYFICINSIGFLGPSL